MANGEERMPILRKTRRIVAHVSTFPPLRCGIASFTTDLIAATPELTHACYGLHYGGSTSDEWDAEADVNSVEDLVKLARLISASECDVVDLQHEFGIWGGSEGENIHAFLDNLNKPILSVLHTTFGPGAKSPTQTDIILRLIQESTVIVVMTGASKESLEMLAGRNNDKIIVLPHGLPDYPYVLPPPQWSKERYCAGSPLRLITPGYFREDKGHEVILHAVRDLRDRGYNISYVIAGEPQQQFAQQESHRRRVEHLVEAWGLQQNVSIEGRYLSLDEQTAFIGKAHVGIFGYQDSLLASSGTIPLVMSVGRPVICTPFEYAMIKSYEISGVFLAADFSPRALAEAIEHFIHIEGYEAVSDATYRETRKWLWPVIGRAFTELIVAAC
jgi:glycosyltransferase involved in cell wall biosynthesis